MKGLENFLILFGDMTLSDIAQFLMAALFLYAVYKELKKFNDNKIKEIEEEKLHKKNVEDAWAITQKYPQYHQESIDIRNNLKQEIQEIRDCFDAVIKRLDDIEKENKKRECSKLRDMLVQNYRYYTNEQHNPTHSWTRMESEAFWELFREYENAGGNGYMHTDVKPAMERLIVREIGK